MVGFDSGPHFRPFVGPATLVNGGAVTVAFEDGSVSVVGAPVTGAVAPTAALTDALGAAAPKSTFPRGTTHSATSPIATPKASADITNRAERGFLAATFGLTGAIFTALDFGIGRTVCPGTRGT